MTVKRGTFCSGVEDGDVYDSVCEYSWSVLLLYLVVPGGKGCFCFRAGLNRRDVPNTATDRDVQP